MNNKPEMKCICCERVLPSAFDNSIEHPLDGGEVRISFHYGSRYDHLGYRTSDRTALTTKPEQLASCHKIFGVICDDCFEKKAELLRGYDEIRPKEKLQLAVQ